MVSNSCWQYLILSTAHQQLVDTYDMMSKSPLGLDMYRVDFSDFQFCCEQGFGNWSPVMVLMLVWSKLGHSKTGSCIVQMVKLQDFKLILHITNTCICHCHHSTSRFSSSVNLDQVLFWVCHSTKQNCSSLLPYSFGDQNLQFRFQCHYNLILPILLYLSKP